MGWEMKLIDNWKQAWKLKSVQVGAISAFFYALILFSEQFLNVWAVIPQELKNKIPEVPGPAGHLPQPGWAARTFVHRYCG